MSRLTHSGHGGGGAVRAAPRRRARWRPWCAGFVLAGACARTSATQAPTSLAPIDARVLVTDIAAGFDRSELAATWHRSPTLPVVVVWPPDVDPDESARDVVAALAEWLVRTGLAEVVLESRRQAEVAGGAAPAGGDVALATARRLGASILVRSRWAVAGRQRGSTRLLVSRLEVEFVEVATGRAILQQASERDRSVAP